MFERKSHEIKEGYNKEVLLEVLRNFDNSGESVNEERNRIKRFKIEHNGKEKEINVKCFSRKNRTYSIFWWLLWWNSRRKKNFLYKWESGISADMQGDFWEWKLYTRSKRNNKKR